jgi:hypothetical protein
VMALRMEIADMPRPVTPMDAQMAGLLEDSHASSAAPTASRDQGAAQGLHGRDV